MPKKKKSIKVPANSELLDPLREINNRQAQQDFSLGGIPEKIISIYKSKKWLSKAGVITMEGYRKLEALDRAQ
jgi:hypothetical protein